MNFKAKPMTQTTAIEILNWRYPYPYDFYNNQMDDEALSEMLDGSYREIHDEYDKLMGFYCTGNSAQVPAGRKTNAYQDGYIDFGLGMEPSQTGQRNGDRFFAFIKQQIHTLDSAQPLRLTVATFNKRAIHLYDKFGFIKDNSFITDFTVFQTMVEKLGRHN